MREKTRLENDVIYIADGKIESQWWTLVYAVDIAESEMLDFLLREKLCDFDPANVNIESYTDTFFYKGHQYGMQYSVYEEREDEYGDMVWEVSPYVEIRKYM